VSRATRRNPDANFRALKLMVQAEAARKAFYGRRAGAVYQSSEELLLEAGRRWSWQPLARDLSPLTRWGFPAACYANSLLAAILHSDLRYVEGFAYAGAFPIHHAWNVDSRGVVQDFTWREDQLHPREGRAYLGVVVSIERAMHAIWDLSSTVLEDPPHYASLMERWVVDHHPPRPKVEAITELLDAAMAEIRLEAEHGL
jgi:hypothetical protein